MTRLLACLLAVASLAWSTAAPAASLPKSDADIWAEYFGSIAATASPTPASAESADQWAYLNPSNPNQVWRTDASGNRQILVESYTDYAGYDSLVGQNYTTRSSSETWVGLVPEAKDFIAEGGTDGTTLDNRLKEYLGLPPDNNANRVVQFWVNADDLMRPSVNPDPFADHSPGYGLRDFIAAMTAANDSSYDIAGKNYAQWFSDRKDTIYYPNSTNGNRAYPWTGFGYTYDYSSDSANNVGLNEFLIKPGSTVQVDSVSSTANYFK